MLKYSAVIKLARLIVVQEAYEQRQEEIRRYKSRGLTADQASEKANNYYYLTRRLVHSFMTMRYDSRDPTPMQWLYQSRSYGFKIRYTMTVQGCTKAD